MTIFRSSTAVAVAGALLVCACTTPDPPTTPVTAIVHSTLDGKALLDQFSARLAVLRKNRTNFESEMESAGFLITGTGSGCYRYTLGFDGLASVGTGIHAFVRFCGEDHQVELRRWGISRQPMTIGSAWGSGFPTMSSRTSVA